RVQREPTACASGEQAFPTRAAKPRDPRKQEAAEREVALARAYAHAFIPEHAMSGQWTRWDGFSGRWKHNEPDWSTRRFECTAAEVRWSLFRGDKIDVQGVEYVRHVTIDIDAHGIAEDAERIPRHIWRREEFERAASP